MKNVRIFSSFVLVCAICMSLMIPAFAANQQAVENVKQQSDVQRRGMVCDCGGSFEQVGSPKVIADWTSRAYGHECPHHQNNHTPWYRRYVTTTHYKCNRCGMQYDNNDVQTVIECRVN